MIPTVPIMIPATIESVVLPPITPIARHIPMPSTSDIIMPKEYVNMVAGSFALASNFLSAITFDASLGAYSFAIDSAKILSVFMVEPPYNKLFSDSAHLSYLMVLLYITQNTN